MAQPEPKHLNPDAPAKKHTWAIVLVCAAIVAAVVVADLYQKGSFGQLLQRVSATSQEQGGQSSTPEVVDLPASQDQEGDEQADATGEQGDSAEATEEVPAEPVTIEAMMIGDILMHDNLVQSGLQEDGTYNYDFIYDHIRPYIDAADVRILNQETVMGLPDRGFYMTNGAMGPIMNTPTALADSEMRFGFNVILNAHNHVYDQGYDGLAHEMDYWKQNYPDVPIVGVNNPLHAEGDESQNLVDNVYVYEKDGFRIAILNHTYDTNEHPNYETDGQFCSYMTEEKVRADVQKARDMNVDLIIACPHWGVQYTTEPSNEEWTFSKLYTELGVDLIFGCHPHILQHVEMLRNADGHKTVCYYSLGNFVATLMSPECLIGGIARATFVKEPDGTARVEAASLVPTVCVRTMGPNMTAFPILEYNWDLTAQNASGMTPDGAQAFCSQVFGEGYDPATGIYTLNMADEGRLV